jgi:LysM repeat protein
LVSGLDMSGERGPPPSPSLGPHGTGSIGFCVRSGMAKNLKEKRRKASCLPLGGRACQKKPPMAKSGVMKFLAIIVTAVFFAAAFGQSISAQTFTHTPGPSASSAEAAKLEALAKKIDEQNAKIDTLSQQILKLEKQIASMRQPGVIIGEATPSATVAPAPSEAPAHSANGGSSHTVARGETLTSIAKMHGTTISELQKFNHIENPMKLQIGQTIMIPAPSTSSSPAD